MKTADALPIHAPTPLSRVILYLSLFGLYPVYFAVIDYYGMLYGLWGTSWWNDPVGRPFMEDALAMRDKASTWFVFYSILAWELSLLLFAALGAFVNHFRWRHT